MFTILTIVNGFTNSNNAIRRNKLITNNIKLVHYIANNYKSSKNNENDLLQEGMYGLIKAADKFDHTRNIAFSTYASYWIRSYMIKHIHNEKHIRIPSEKRKQNVKRFVHFLDTFHEYDEISKDNNNNEQNLTIY